MKFFLSGLFLSFSVLSILIILLRHYLFELTIGWFLPALAGMVTVYFVLKASKKSSINLTKTIAIGFIIKMFYYGISLVLLIQYYTFQPIVFVCSFTGFFLVLHIVEAILIKRISVLKNTN